MRRAISVILAAVLITTPIKMVLAQAGQQASQVTATNIPSVPQRTDQTPARIGVPVVEPNSGAALLFTVGMRDHTLTRDSLPFSPPFRRVSTVGWVAIVVVGAVVLLAVLVTVAFYGGAFKEHDVDDDSYAGSQESHTVRHCCGPQRRSGLWLSDALGFGRVPICRSPRYSIGWKRESGGSGFSLPFRRPGFRCVAPGRCRASFMLMQFSDQSQTPKNRPYSGLAFQRSPGGFEFAVVSWVVPGVETPVPVIAILGYRGYDIAEAAWKTHLRDAITDPLSAAVTLVCLRESNGPKWPAVENGRLISDRRHDRLFALELHPYDFSSQVLGLEPVGDESIYPQRLREVLGSQLSGPDQAHEVGSIAKWNFSKTEYGSPTDASRQAVQEAAQGLVATFCETQRTGTADAPGLVAPLQEIDKCREREDLTQLAAWLELLVAGSRRLHDTVRVVQQEGLSEISSWNDLGTAPSRVARALENGSGLHRMFYDSHPEFGHDTWIWRGRGPKTVALRSPRLIGIARYQLGRAWWHGLTWAFASHDHEGIESGLGKLRQLNAALATRALVEPEEGSEAAMTLGFGADVDFVTIDLDTIPDSHPSPPPFDIDAQIQAALRPRHWEVYRRINIEKEKAKDVATSMRLSPGRISQLLSEANDALKGDQPLRSLWENLGE